MNNEIYVFFLSHFYYFVYLFQVKKYSILLLIELCAFIISRTETCLCLLIIFCCNRRIKENESRIYLCNYGLISLEMINSSFTCDFCRPNFLRKNKKMKSCSHSLLFETRRPIHPFKTFLSPALPLISCGRYRNRTMDGQQLAKMEMVPFPPTPKYPD